MQRKLESSNKSTYTAVFLLSVLLLLNNLHSEPVGIQDVVFLQEDFKIPKGSNELNLNNVIAMIYDESTGLLHISYIDILTKEQKSTSFFYIPSDTNFIPPIERYPVDLALMTSSCISSPLSAEEICITAVEINPITPQY